MAERALDTLTDHPENVKIYGGDEPDRDLVLAIKKHGIIEPLVITPDGTILSGHRRAKAARKAGLSRVPVIERVITDELEQIEIIVDSNRQRRKTNWQMAQEVGALMDVERKRAKRRMSEGGKGGVDADEEGEESVPSLGPARDKVGEKLGMSGRQVDKLSKIREVIEGIGEDDEETVLDIKTTLNEQSVSAAYNHEAVREHRKRQEKTPPFYVLFSKWEKMGKEERETVLKQPRSETKTFNDESDKDSIEWAQWSWNPVTGCLHNCPYCYAHDQAHRFYEWNFTPAFLPERLSMPANTAVPPEADDDVSYKNVFTCSMADLFGRWVPQEWIDAVLNVIREQNQWNYLMLTKFPQRLSEQDWPKNAWVGATIDRQADVDKTLKAFAQVEEETEASFKWLSLEPLLEPLDFEQSEHGSLEPFDMVVVGGASRSKRTPEWVPPSSWYEKILQQARDAECAVYAKTNLHYRPQEYPGETARTEERAPEVFFRPRNTVDE